MLLQLSYFFLPFIPLHPAPTPPTIIPPLQLMSMGCTSALTSLFLTPCLTSPHVFYAYQLCFLFPVPFPSLILPLQLPTDNPPWDLHFCDSVPVLVVCLFCFCFLGSVVDSCKFVVIFLFVVLIFFFFLDKSL